MASLNAIFRPQPDGMKMAEIPEWMESFAVAAAKQMTLRLAYNPRGDDPPRISEAAACTPQACEELGEEELRGLWREYFNKMDGFDGVYKMKNAFGNFDYYFYRHGINDFGGEICKSGTVQLPVAFSRTEGIVLERWTSLNEANFKVCDADAETGEYVYAFDIEDDELVESLKDDLASLTLALLWQSDNAGRTDNPYNRGNLPLGISLEKVGELESFLPDFWDSAWKWALGIPGGLAVLLAGGASFFAGGDLWAWAKGLFAGPGPAIGIVVFPWQRDMLYPPDHSHGDDAI